MSTIRVTSIAAGPAPAKVIRVTSIAADIAVQHDPPVVVGRTDIDAAAGETWALGATEFPAPGAAIVSRSWSLQSKTTGAPDVVLSSTTDPAPTFTTPILDTDVVYTFLYTVTDGAGLTGSDSVTVVVHAADLAVATSSGWLPAAILQATGDGWI